MVISDERARCEARAGLQFASREVPADIAARPRRASATERAIGPCVDITEKIGGRLGADGLKAGTRPKEGLIDTMPQAYAG